MSQALPGNMKVFWPTACGYIIGVVVTVGVFVGVIVGVCVRVGVIDGVIVGVTDACGVWVTVGVIGGVVDGVGVGVILTNSPYSKSWVSIIFTKKLSSLYESGTTNSYGNVDTVAT